MSETLTFDFHSDPGHGWIEVAKCLLPRLIGPDWRSLFSPFSYESRDCVYLEEDADADRFIKACQQRGVELKFRELPQARGDSPIRNYPPLASTRDI